MHGGVTQSFTTVFWQPARVVQGLGIPQMEGHGANGIREKLPLPGCGIKS